MTFIFPELFGDTDRCRMLEVLVENPRDEFFIGHLMFPADVESHNVAHRIIADFERDGIVTVERSDDIADRISLNVDNPICKMLIMLERTIVISKLDGVIDTFPERLPNGLCKPIVMDARFCE